MKSLEHKHVVRLFDVLKTSNNIYMVLELVDGGELFTRIKPDGMGEQRARRYFTHLICAVDYCHQEQVAHRDLKPENLLLTRDDELKISDFGLSNLQHVNERGTVSDSMKLQTACGTPNYVAPEVISTMGGYNGFKADVWSCGVILYHMLAGFLPFRGPHVQDLLKKIKFADPEACPRISGDAKDLILQLLRKEPVKRIKVSDVLTHPWVIAGRDAEDQPDAERAP
ncbi:CBL-interacting serine/threonine-protein kinase 23 [Diplonema papillatum]|nr:CBL-interacting serine/threonine-protein kinase 23 [Diplonema papillatum]